MAGSKSDRVKESLSKVRSKAMGILEGELLWTPRAAQGWWNPQDMPCLAGRGCFSPRFLLSLGTSISIPKEPLVSMLTRIQFPGLLAGPPQHHIFPLPG